jgi:hypothetical protein
MTVILGQQWLWWCRLQTSCRYCDPPKFKSAG